MSIARTAAQSPRTFVLGLALGVVLVSAGFLLALFVTGPVGAATPGGTVPARVNPYTGDVRMGYPGQPLNCNQSEYPLELSAGNAADDLSYAVRTVEDDVSGSTYFSAHRTVDCLAGETALSGGSRLKDGDKYINSSAFMNQMNGPIGSPPSGWMSGFQYSNNSPKPDAAVETWVLCVS